MLKRTEMLIGFAVSCAMIVAGLVWRFGVYGLLCSGGVLLVALLLMDPIDIPKRPKMQGRQ